MITGIKLYGTEKVRTEKDQDLQLKNQGGKGRDIGKEQNKERCMD